MDGKARKSCFIHKSHLLLLNIRHTSHHSKITFGCNINCWLRWVRNGFYKFFGDFLLPQEKDGKMKPGVWWQCGLRNLTVCSKACGKPSDRLETKATTSNPALNRFLLIWTGESKTVTWDVTMLVTLLAMQNDINLSCLAYWDIGTGFWIGETGFQSTLNTRHVVCYNCIIIRRAPI